MPTVQSDQQQGLERRQKWLRLPLTGNRIVQAIVDDTPARVWRAKLYEEWTLQAVYGAGASGTLVLEGTHDVRADVNLNETQWQGDPELNTWVQIGTVAANGQIDQPAETYELVRLRGQGVSGGTITATITARQFNK